MRQLSPRTRPDVLGDARLPMEQRLLWALMLFMGNLLAVPVYFFVRIWNAPEARLTES